MRHPIVCRYQVLCYKSIAIVDRDPKDMLATVLTVAVCCDYMEHLDIRTLRHLLEDCADNVSTAIRHSNWECKTISANEMNVESDDDVDLARMLCGPAL